MRNLRVWNSAVLAGYAFLLVVLAYFFFAHELHISPYQDVQLSDDFIVRFSAFWFISFLLTILVYLLNLSLNYVWIPRAEKIVAIQAGKFIFSAGLFGALVIYILFAVLSENP